MWFATWHGPLAAVVPGAESGSGARLPRLDLGSGPGVLTAPITLPLRNTRKSVARLLEPGASHSGVAAELGVTPTQLQTWRLELEAAGSVAAIATQKAEAAELAQLRRNNKRLTEEVEVLRKASQAHICRRSP